LDIIYFNEINIKYKLRVDIPIKSFPSTVLSNIAMPEINILIDVILGMTERRNKYCINEINSDLNEKYVP